jgi:hypothetical protein
MTLKVFTWFISKVPIDRASVLNRLKSVYSLNNQAELTSNKFSYFDDDKYVNVFEYGRWFIDFYRQDFAGCTKDIIAPDDDRCIQIALEAIAPFTSDWELIEPVDVGENKAGYQAAGSSGKAIEYEDGKSVRLSAVPKKPKLRIFGDVIVKIGENGVINSIDDNRMYFETLREVPIISSRAAVNKAKRGGFEHELTDMVLNYVELEYRVDRVKGHLLPVYNLSGTAKTADGTVEDWSTYISAMK